MFSIKISFKNHVFFTRNSKHFVLGSLRRRKGAQENFHRRLGRWHHGARFDRHCLSIRNHLEYEDLGEIRARPLWFCGLCVPSASRGMHCTIGQPAQHGPVQELRRAFCEVEEKIWNLSIFLLKIMKTNAILIFFSNFFSKIELWKPNLFSGSCSRYASLLEP